MRPARLGRLPAHPLPGNLRVLETPSFGARLLGLALLDDLEPDTALLIRHDGGYRERERQGSAKQTDVSRIRLAARRTRPR